MPHKYKTLVADIGGTNSRFAIIENCVSKPAGIIVFRNDDYADFEQVVAQAVSEIGLDFSRVVIAVAGPLKGQSATLTNRDWLISPERLRPVVNCADIKIINDFAALAAALPFLPADGLETIANSANEQPGHQLVVGAGTGLGVGFLIRTGAAWTVAPGEGGHVSLPAQTSREFEILTELNEGMLRVSAERALSGPGLVELYNGICRLNSCDLRASHPTEVIQAAHNFDPAAQEAATTFVRLLGRVAGDHALALIPRGGIYLGGGVTPRLLELTGSEIFIDEFCNKGRVSGAISDIPIHIIREEFPGLIGAGAFALNRVTEGYGSVT